MFACVSESVQMGFQVCSFTVQIADPEEVYVYNIMLLYLFIRSGRSTIFNLQGAVTCLEQKQDNLRAAGDSHGKM